MSNNVRRRMKRAWRRKDTRNANGSGLQLENLERRVLLDVAGFWDELVAGFVKYNEDIDSPLPLAFFTWHARIEGQHAAHTQEELEELYFDRDVDEDAFIETGNEMLEGVAAFWTGLDEQRRRIAAI